MQPECCPRMGLTGALMILLASNVVAQSEPDPRVGTSSQSTAQNPASVEENAQVVRVDLSEANELVQAGRFSEAEQLLLSLIEQSPDDLRIVLMRGEVLLALNRHADALPLLERVAELDGNRPRVHFQLGAALQATGDRQGALDAFARELELNPDPRVQVMALLNRSMLLEQQKDWIGSAAELEAVLELEPDRVEAHGDVASLYLRAGELDSAASRLAQGLECGFQSANHHYVLGARYYENKAYEAAVQALLQALEIDPGLAEAERSLAGALDQVGRGAEALEHLRRYLELEPEAPDAQRVRDRIREIEAR